MSWIAELLNGAIKPEEISKAIQPILKDAEETIAAAVSTAIQGGIDRFHGAKITTVTTIEFPPPKAEPAR